MKLLIFVAALICSVAFARSDSDVIEYTGETFDAGVKQHTDEGGMILVEFYAPWCGHCKKLAPEYEKAATALKANDPSIPIAKVDCPANNELCSRFGVSGYPTLKIFRSLTDMEDYNGPRDSGGIVKFLKGRSGPASKEIKTVEELEKFRNNKGEMLIGFFSDASAALSKEFTKAASKLRESFALAHTFSPEVQKAAGMKCEDKCIDEIVFWRPKHLQSKLEDFEIKLGDASADSDKIQKFAKDNIPGLAGIYTSDSATFFKKPLAVVYFDVDYVKNPKGTNYWRNRVIKVAKKFVGTMNFAIASKDDNMQVLEEISADMSDLNCIIWNDKEQKFKMADKFSLENLEKFVQSYLDGKVEPYLKSEALPEDNTGPVKVIVAKNFDEIVNNPEKDVLIEFYAPWCGHCKSLEPKYKELGEAFANEDSIVIAKMDATANDVPPQFEVRGFPTIFWAPKDNKKTPKKYEGGREVKDFVKFIKSEASKKDIKTKDEL